LPFHTLFGSLLDTFLSAQDTETGRVVLCQASNVGIFVIPTKRRRYDWVHGGIYP